MFCDTLARVSMRPVLVAGVADGCLVHALLLQSPRFRLGSQSGLGVISFQFIQPFDQNFVLLVSYLQTLNVSIASLPSLLCKGKYKSERSEKVE